MAKLICTSRYTKNSKSNNAGNLVKYMGTREGVEKLPAGYDRDHAAKKYSLFYLLIKTNTYLAFSNHRLNIPQLIDN